MLAFIFTKAVVTRQHPLFEIGSRSCTDLKGYLQQEVVSVLLPPSKQSDKKCHTDLG